MWIRPFGSPADDSVFEKGTAEKLSLVLPPRAGFKRQRYWLLGPFDLALLGFPEGTPLFSLYTSLQKELKQITFPTSQMALVVIKVAPKTDVDVHQQQGKIQPIVDLTS